LVSLQSAADNETNEITDEELQQYAEEYYNVTVRINCPKFVIINFIIYRSLMNLKNGLMRMIPPTTTLMNNSRLTSVRL
jgi:hypothetical protein